MHAAVTPEHLPQSSCSGSGVRVGVFDSGLGGLSILRAIRAALPAADLLYVADSGHAPYGERDEAFILARSLRISHFLVAQGVDALVVACNTATAAAVHALRAEWPDLPIVGVEPGVKPAVALSRNHRVGVMATPRTLASDKFQQLVQRHGHEAQVTLQPCPGLAKAIEGGDLSAPSVLALVDSFTAPLKAAGVDTVVLGCTHYPFVAPAIARAMGPDVQIIDTAEAVARRLVHQLGKAQVPDVSSTPGAATGRCRLWSSSEPAHLEQTARLWLGLDAPAQPLGC